MKKKSRYILLISVPAFAVLSLFQNCSAPTESDGSATALPYTNNFSAVSASAGAQFSKTALPYPPRGRLVADLNSYATVSGYKAVAIAANGYGLATGSTLFVSQDEADRVIQQECQLLANNSPCVIFAEGDTVKYDLAAIPNHMTTTIDGGVRPFESIRVPLLLSTNEYYIDPVTYYTAGNFAFKAFAIGDYGRAAHGAGDSQDEADQRALQACEGIDGMPCTLYAEGDNVVFNSTVFSWRNFFPSLIYGNRPFLAGDIPFVSVTDRTKIQSSIRPGQHWALAVSRYGDNYLATDTTSSAAALQAIAIAVCNAAIPQGSDYSCMVHSVDNVVVWTINDVKAHNTPSSVWN